MRSLLIMLAAAACSGKRAPAPEDARAESIVEPSMATVPAGWFTEGCTNLIAPAQMDAADVENATHTLQMCVEEFPPRRVWVPSYEIDTLETTAAEYDRCVGAGACGRRRLTRFRTDDGWIPVGGRLPAVVEHDDAARYCAWRGVRLPSTAEWQKAARGTDQRAFPWGDQPPDCQRTWRADRSLWDLQCGPSDIRPVGKLREGASPYGLLDMEDNAPEWTSDKQHGYYWPTGTFQYRRELRGEYAVLTFDWRTLQFRWPTTVIDPHYPVAGGNWVVMGGWHEPGINSLHGVETGEDFRQRLAGFRCARTLPGPPPPTLDVPQVRELSLPFREPGFTPP